MTKQEIDKQEKELRELYNIPDNWSSHEFHTEGWTGGDIVDPENGVIDIILQEGEENDWGEIYLHILCFRKP